MDTALRPQPGELVGTAAGRSEELRKGVSGTVSAGGLSPPRSEQSETLDDICSIIISYETPHLCIY